MSIYPAHEAQIVLLMAEKVFVLAIYLSFINLFLKKLVVEFFNSFDINEHLINLKLNKELLYGSIYSLGLVKLKTLKTNIKINLVNGFIWSPKSSVKVSILFVQKRDCNFCFYVNYLTV